MAVHPDDYAIVIGINGYSQLRPLRAAHGDAAKFMEWLIAPDGGGLPDNDQHRRTIISPETLPNDPLDARPVQREIDKALRDFGVERGQRIGRRLYFYFSGHGVGPSFDDIALLMADAAMNRLNSNLGLRPYRQFFHAHAFFDEVVYLLDCCRDPVRMLAVTAPVFTLVNGGAPPPVQDFVVMAAAYGEKAFEPNVATTGERRGVLTTALLEGLRGAPAAVDAQGRITAATLQSYLRTRVPALAQEAQLKQEPEIQQLRAGELVFAVQNVRQRVRIIAPAGLGGTLSLRDALDIGREIANSTAAAATANGPGWVVELPRANVRYPILHSPSLQTAMLDMTQAQGDPYVFQFSA